MYATLTLSILYNSDMSWNYETICLKIVKYVPQWKKENRWEDVRLKFLQAPLSLSSVYSHK